MAVPTLDSQSYPHILDTVIAQASHSVLLAFRGTSRLIRDAVDQRLFTHIVLKDGSLCLLDALTLYTVSGTDDAHGSSNSPPIPLPPTSDPSSSTVLQVFGASRDGSHAESRLPHSDEAAASVTSVIANHDSYLIIQPLSKSGIALVPPDARLAHVRTLDIHSCTHPCQCQRCEGSYDWTCMLEEGRFRALIALCRPPTLISGHLRLLRIMGEFGETGHLPYEYHLVVSEAFRSFRPRTRVVHFHNALPDSDCTLDASESNPARRLTLTALNSLHQLGGWSDVIFNFRYSPEDQGFPFMTFHGTTGEGGKTIFILFTPDPAAPRWVDAYPERRVNSPRILNQLAYHVAMTLRAVPDNGGDAYRVVLVGPETWDAAWISSSWWQCSDGLPPGTSVEDRFRWWVGASGKLDADRIQAGIAYASLEELRGYIDNEIEYGLIMAP